MGLMRRNPARTWQLTPPDLPAMLAFAPEPASPAANEPAPPPPISSAERHRLIAGAAYAHAERSGFVTDPLADWLLAEREIDAQLAVVSTKPAASA
jgi:hypothetical protein